MSLNLELKKKESLIHNLLGKLIEVKLQKFPHKQLKAAIFSIGPIADMKFENMSNNHPEVLSDFIKQCQLLKRRTVKCKVLEKIEYIEQFASEFSKKPNKVPSNLLESCIGNAQSKIENENELTQKICENLIAENQTSEYKVSPFMVKRSKNLFYFQLHL